MRSAAVRRPGGGAMGSGRKNKTKREACHNVLHAKAVKVARLGRRVNLGLVGRLALWSGGSAKAAWA